MGSQFPTCRNHSVGMRTLAVRMGSPLEGIRDHDRRRAHRRVCRDPRSNGCLHVAEISTSTSTLAQLVRERGPAHSIQETSTLLRSVITINDDHSRRTSDRICAAPSGSFHGAEMFLSGGWDSERCSSQGRQLGASLPTPTKQFAFSDEVSTWV